MKLFFMFVVIFTLPFLYLQDYSYAQEVEKKNEYKTWKFQYEEKCSKCHALDRVFADKKTKEEWQQCVKRMIEKNPQWITPEEGAHIVDEIVMSKDEVVVSEPQIKKYADARLLFIDRCTRCHSSDRILSQNKNRKGWDETVQRMRDNAPELFLDEDLPIIADFLTERSHIMKEDVASDILVNRCIVCHEGDRILLERKSKRDWQRCVTEMRKITRKKLKKDWFTHHEFKIIVDLLVRTQGIETENH